MKKPSLPAPGTPKNLYASGLVKITYFLAFLLIIGWAVGFIGFHAGNEIHLLLAIAMVTVLVNIVRGK